MIPLVVCSGIFVVSCLAEQDSLRAAVAEVLVCDASAAGCIIYAGDIDGSAEIVRTYRDALQMARTERTVHRIFGGDFQQVLVFVLAGFGIVDGYAFPFELDFGERAIVGVDPFDAVERENHIVHIELVALAPVFPAEEIEILLHIIGIGIFVVYRYRALDAGSKHIVIFFVDFVACFAPVAQCAELFVELARREYEAVGISEAAVAIDGIESELVAGLVGGKIEIDLRAFGEVLGCLGFVIIAIIFQRELLAPERVVFPRLLVGAGFADVAEVGVADCVIAVA